MADIGTLHSKGLISRKRRMIVPVSSFVVILSRHVEQRVAPSSPLNGVRNRGSRSGSAEFKLSSSRVASNEGMGP